MAHHFERDYHLDLDEQGNLQVTLYAIWKDKRLDVYKENENGEAFIRDTNLVWYQMGGWLVNYPNENVQTYWEGKFKCELYSYQKIVPNSLGDCELRVNEVLELKPEYKYLLQKIKTIYIRFHELCKLIKLWKENQKVEFIIMSDYMRLAQDKRFFKMNDKKKKEIITYCNSLNLKVTEKMHLSLNDYYLMKKFNCPYNQLGELRYYSSYAKENVDKVRKIFADGYNLNEYIDYFNLCLALGKDINDPYWGNPKKKLRERYQILHRESIAIKNALKKEETLLMNNNLKSFKSSKKIINGYQIYLPKDMEDIHNQADVLHQCLITNFYYKRYAKKELCLVFIKDLKNNPVATAEITLSNKLGQFYGDEMDRNNCKPSEEVVKAFNQWFKHKNVKKLLSI